MKTWHNLFFILAAGIFLSSCEEVVDIKLDSGTSQLAVDGVVLVNDGPQRIRLTLTQPYFANGKPAVGASGAEVSIKTSFGQTYTFTEDPARPGDYVSADTIRGKTGEVFNLLVRSGGENYAASSVLMRGTVIDTLNQENRPSEFGNPAGVYLNLVARDSLGPGDFYWIRYALNGVRDLRPGKLLVSADAAFAPGSADGLEFIYPVKNSINNDKPYEAGDKIDVEILSIDFELWRFLNETNTQINNSGLFAEPIANVRGNIQNQNPASRVQAVGCFGIGRVSRASVSIR
jgi:hypothetical protein